MRFRLSVPGLVLAFVALQLVVTGSAAAAPRKPKLPEVTQPDALVLLTSYGEKPNDLIELLVPFLAKHDFAMDRPRRIDDKGVASASFQNTDALGYDKDFIVVAGRYNCVIVAYFSSPYERLSRPVNGILRSAQFRVDLEGFVQSLPTPRLRTEDIVWGKKQVTCTP